MLRIVCQAYFFLQHDSSKAHTFECCLNVVTVQHSKCRSIELGIVGYKACNHGKLTYGFDVQSFQNKYVVRVLYVSSSHKSTSNSCSYLASNMLITRITINYC